MVTARHARQRSCIQLTHAGRYKNAPPSTAQHHTTHANIPWACTRRQCEATNHLADSHRPPRTVRRRTRTDCKRHRWKSNRRTTGPPGLLPNRHQRKEKKTKDQPKHRRLRIPIPSSSASYIPCKHSNTQNTHTTAQKMKIIIIKSSDRTQTTPPLPAQA